MDPLRRRERSIAGGMAAMPIQINGLSSGLDSASIIRSLIAISSAPIRLMQSKVGRLQLEQTSLGGLDIQLGSLRGISQNLSVLSAYRQRLATSSNSDVLTASATSSASLGAYTFTVGKTASAAQAMSKGFADSSTTTVGAGAFTVEFGTRTTSAFLDPKTALSFLNASTGVARGSIKITDRAGNAAVIDLAAAENVQDVLDRINANGTAKVLASVSADSLVVTDQSGSTANNLKVEEVGGRTVAQNLGILKNVASSTLTGDDVNTLSAASKLEILNNGLGVRNASGTDFTISVDGAAAFNVSLASTVSSVQDVITAIQDAATGAGESLTVSLKSGKNGLQIVDNAGDGGSIAVTDVSGAAADLGINKTAAGDTLTGNDVIPSLNTVLAKTLQGGSGIATVSGNDLRVTLTNGSTFDVDLDSDTQVNFQQILDAIKAAHDAAYPATASSFTVETNGAGNGLRLRDSYGGTGNLTVAALNGSSAPSNLGILKTGSAGTLEGDDVDRQFISSAMKLADLNRGLGVFKGKFQVVDRQGKVFTVDGSSSTLVTVAHLINQFNTAATAAGSAATMAVNSGGDGVSLASPSGTGTFSVTDLEGGTMARDLNLDQSVSSSTINGTNEISVTVSSADTLDTVATTVNNLGKGVSASVINDGSPSNPYRLVLTARGTGEAGSILVDRKTTSMDFERTLRAQNAVVLVGSAAGGSNPLLVAHPDNTIENILTGLTIDVKSASTAPVTVTVANDDDKVANELASFVGSFNAAVTQLRAQMDYNPDTKKGGVLLGNDTARLVEDRIFRILRTRIAGLPSALNRIQQLGVSVSDGGLLEFDKSAFLTKFRNDPTGVERILRSGANVTAGMALSSLRAGEGVRMVSGPPDFQITARSGATFKVNLDGALTIQAVLTAINTASGNPGVTAAISSDGSGITLTDASSGSNNLNVVSINGAFAAGDLGIAGTAITAGGSTSTTLKGSGINANGLMQIVARDLDLLTRSVDGVLTRADDALQSKVDDVQKQIDALQVRINVEEQRLTKQFAQLESILSTSQSIASFLSQQFNLLAGLQGTKGSGTSGLKLK